jgi:hypothetical protein
MAYVYLLKNKTTGYKYIGGKWGKSCNPTMFWVNYFTSSKFVKVLRETYGNGDFVFRIIKIFENDFETQLFEKKLIYLSFKKKSYINFHPNFVGNNMTEEEYAQNLFIHREIASEIGKLTFKNKKGIHGLTPEQKKEICSKGGFSAAVVNKLNNKGIFNKEVRDRQHKTLRETQKSAYYDPSTRKILSSKGGKRGLFSDTYRDKNNISYEKFLTDQSNRGKKGGRGNKGFIWYNNGVDIFKYTKKQQEDTPFDIFIINNTQFKKGRLLTNKT